MGCDQAQGFHWSPAVPGDVLADMLRRDAFHTHTGGTTHDPAIGTRAAAERTPAALSTTSSVA
jgi:hypothetical protein